MYMYMGTLQASLQPYTGFFASDMYVCIVRIR